VSNLLGAPCTLTIVHTEKDGKTYSNISSVAPVMKSMTCPDQINPNNILSYDAFDWEIYNSLPEFLQNQMAATPEYGRLQSAMATQNRVAVIPQSEQTQSQQPIEDDLPF